LIPLVYRVNWLKAKARVDRWEEEFILVKNEMQWTILWFRHHANLWKGRSERKDGNLPMGHKAYAVKQQKLYNAFAEKSLDKFSLYIPSD
jgi:hypothetical protein